MSVEALQDYTYVSKYARYDKTKKRRETWDEAVDRVEGMHLRKYPQAEEQIRWAFDKVREKRVLGSQRALQFGGAPIEKVNARLYNCSVSFCDRLRFFQEAFWMLLCGSGVGFSVQKHHVVKLPAFAARNENNDPRSAHIVHVVEDSIEGWADALGVLLSSYFVDAVEERFVHLRGKVVKFDFSLIRKVGSPLSSSGGKAPGPEPLKKALEKIRELLDRCMAAGQTHLRPIDAYDVLMHASDAVLSGGVRRSATICVFSPDDEEMIKAKTGNWFYENPQRARSNNSVLLLRGETTWEQFEKLMQSVQQFGEPGFVWADSTEFIVNPCCEIGFYPVDVETGKSGWQTCVSGNTYLLTKQGKVQIGDVVGEEVEIWNGSGWKKVVPFKTGSGRKLYRVRLSDGSHLDCTDNHKWLVKNRFQKKYSEVETKDLMDFSKYQISTPKPQIKWEGEKNITDAYELGFVLGDGCCHRTDTASGIRKPFATLFGHDHELGLKCRVRPQDVSERYEVESTCVAFDTLDPDFCHRLKYESGLPQEVFTWNRKSCYEFISGWMDADGSKSGRGFRIYGEKSKLADLQMLLTKLGFYSSLNIMSEEGEVTNYGLRNQSVWYVQVNDVGDLYSRRIKFDRRPRIRNGKGACQVVKSVTELSGLHDTFCVYEPEKNTCVFNNVLTKQCNLCEINGKMLKSHLDFRVAAQAAAIIGTCQAGYTDFPYLGEVSERIIRREALLGVSITGMFENPSITFDPPFSEKWRRR